MAGNKRKINLKRVEPPKDSWGTALIFANVSKRGWEERVGDYGVALKTQSRLQDLLSESQLHGAGLIRADHVMGKDILVIVGADITRDKLVAELRLLRKVVKKSGLDSVRSRFLSQSQKEDLARTSTALQRQVRQTKSNKKLHD